MPATSQSHVSNEIESHYAQKKFNTNQAIKAPNMIRIASIVVEAVLFVLQCVGVSTEASETTINTTVLIVLPVVESSITVQKAVEALEAANAGGSKWEIAKTIFELIIATNSTGILWVIIKSLCSNMGWWDWAKTVTVVTTTIIATFGPGGIALIAKIVLGLNSTYNFIQTSSSSVKGDDRPRVVPAHLREVSEVSVIENKPKYTTSTTKSKL